MLMASSSVSAYCTNVDVNKQILCSELVSVFSYHAVIVLKIFYMVLFFVNDS